MSVAQWAYGAPPVSVIGDIYCIPCPLELVVKKKISSLSKAIFDVFDQTGNILLQVEGGLWNLTMTRTIRDPAGFAILTMRGKAITLSHKWSAYEGQRVRESAPLFTIRQSHPMQIKKELNVFLKNNGRHKPADFRVVGTYTSLSFKVLYKQRIVAEVKHHFTLKSFYKGEEEYHVKVYPEVDYAFIIALLVALDENDTP